jgi:hypothetical protein
MVDKNIDPVLAEIMDTVIDLDCSLQYKLASGSGDFCILGGLMACVDPNWAEHEHTARETMHTKRLLEDMLGIKLTGLYGINDRHQKHDTRRKHLHEWVARRKEQDGV